ncbi:MAG: UvrD-helicase domain-containing protein [Desulfamplus sp.]|nr:UvrD-helicase domain-containing protein [Desulfamplus sp.]
MEFIADLHLHSHFSRATAKNLDLEHICQAAMLKGITVVGTGDFTHPSWFKELEEKLEPAEEGLFKLKDEILKDVYDLPLLIDNSLLIDNNKIPEICKNSVRFILQCEISSIYKKDGRVRKNHNLIYFPDITSVKSFNEKLGKIGNITSDGRPILGLDCQRLLEIMLETSEDGFMIPAHIWTPWFSMFGSKSGFNSVEECFGPLAHHIFAVETGLSSDLPMNWRVENLDKMSFISSSDAHSPMFMGRNASVFNTDLSYKSMKDALRTPYTLNICDKAHHTQRSGNQSLNTQRNSSSQQPNNIKAPYLGTIDMYPEEGKYHYDGHRKCNICFNPSETLHHGGICPECGKPLTLGVLYRVEELASSSRPDGYTPENRHGYQNIIPLAEILSEIFDAGTKTKKVENYYTKAVATLGPELDILLKKEIEEIDKVGIPLLSEAIRRMRNREIHLSPGYDGEFGHITVFTPEEKERLKGESNIFKERNVSKQDKINHIITDKLDHSFTKKSDHSFTKKLKQTPANKLNSIPLLNIEQQKAINSKNRPLLMEAGPGTGKTHTLTEKIVSLIANHNVNPESILALTFTTKAAQEMTQRINKLSEKQGKKNVFVSTFHGFCLMVLKEYTDFNFTIVDDTLRKALIEHAIKLAFPDSKKKNISFSQIELDIAMLKQHNSIKNSLSITNNFEYIQKEILPVLEKYQELLASYNFVDFEDLIVMVLELLKDSKQQNLKQLSSNKTLQQNNNNDQNLKQSNSNQNHKVQNSEILSKLKQRFIYFFVDEYQDINQSQYELIRLLAGDGKNLCVIGDPDQAIYGFRGADNRYFKRFEEDYLNTEKIVFKRNYRSTETILEAAFQLISNKVEMIPNKENNINNIIQFESSQASRQIENNQQAIRTKKRLYSGIEGEQKINILEAASEDAEATIIGKTIERLVGGISMFSMDSGKADASLKDDYSFSDIAVLYRTKKQSEVLSKIFEKAGIPFQTADRDNIFLQKGIKELISCLRILIGIGTIYDLDIASAYNEKLMGVPFIINREKESSEIIKKIIYDLEIDKIINKSKKSIETAELLIKEAEKYPDPTLFYEHIAMKKDIDTVDYKAEKVSLMTMHASKGLEFKVVFIAGCENGLIPFFSYSGSNHTKYNNCNHTEYNNVEEHNNNAKLKSDNRKLYSGKCEDIDEERRLFYVAMTRAEELLYLCYAKKRLIFGKRVEVERSPFLNDIEDRLKNYSKLKFKKIDKPNCDGQLELF